VGLSNAAKADIWLILVTILGAIGWILSKEAVLQMPPFLFISLRFLLAGLLLLVFGYSQVRALNWNQCKQAILVGSVFAIGMCFWIMGLYTGVSISVGSFILSSSVIFSPIIANIFFKEKVPISTWSSMPVALLGLAYLTLTEGFEVQKGQLLFILSSLFIALFFVLNSRAANDQTGVAASEKVPALPLTTLSLLTVGVSVAFVSFALESWSSAAENYSTNLLAWVLASAFIATALRFFMQTYAQSLSMASHGVVIMVVEPIWTALLAAAWFAESLSGNDLIGCVLIFAAVIIIRWTLIQGLFKRSTG